VTSRTNSTSGQQPKQSLCKRFTFVVLMTVGLHSCALLLGSANLSAQETTPGYEIVYTRENVDIANNTEYYVLIDPVDLSSDAFMDTVKSIITDIARVEGKPEFGAKLYTDREVLEYGYELPSSDEFPATQEGIQQYRAYLQSMAAKSASTLIASYVGGIDLLQARASRDVGAYSILWFGSAFTDHPIVGGYVGDEEWKPEVRAQAERSEEEPEEEEDSTCFIATAAYGTSLEPDLDVLRDFRDSHLKGNVVGSRFVDGYYKVGPAAADFIEDRPLLRWYVRDFYLKPTVRVLDWLN